MTKPYNYKKCKSLFVNAHRVHVRSGGLCVLCGFGKKSLEFDLWRQLTVEHLIGKSQGGYRNKPSQPTDITRAVSERFPDLSDEIQQRVIQEIDDANTVTACSLCNSLTSQDKHTKTMDELIKTAPGVTHEEVMAAIQAELQQVLEHKRAAVREKLEAIRRGYEAEVAHELQNARVQRTENIGFFAYSCE